MLDFAALYFAGHILLLFAVSVAIGKIAGPIFIFILESLSKKTRSTLDDRIISSIKVPAQSFFFLVVFYILIHAFPELASAAAVLEHYTFAILVLIASFMLSEATGAAIRWYYEEGAHISSKIKFDLTLLPFVRKVTKIAIYAFGLTVALSAAGFDITGILTITSVIGIILGLASQETLANLFAGLALQIDRPYSYGDLLRLPTGEEVVLRKIGIRSTKLQDMSQNTVIISNSEFAKMRVVNLSLAGQFSVPVQAELPLSANIEKLRERIEKRIKEENPKGFIAEKGVTYSFVSLKQDAVTVAFSFWVQSYHYASPIKKIVYEEIISYLNAKKR